MATSFATHKHSGVVYRLAVELAVAARVFTTTQLARHPSVSGYTNPQRRVREIIAPYRDRFKVVPRLAFNDYLWMLTDKEKRRLRVRYRNVGPSQHTNHWLAFGDIWMELVFNGYRPSKWFTEGKSIGRHDIFAVIRGEPFLIEVQLSELARYEWKDKWRKRYAWLQKELWQDPEWSKTFCNVKPTRILVTGHKMKLERGKDIPKNMIVSDTIDQLPHVLNRYFISRPPQK